MCTLINIVIGISILLSDTPQTLVIEDCGGVEPKVTIQDTNTEVIIEDVMRTSDGDLYFYKEKK